MFALTPEEELDESVSESFHDQSSRLPDELECALEGQRQQKAKKGGHVFFRTIVGLPLPKSGKYENVPPEVVAAALGKVIHLLHCLIKYLKITYPHPMNFNGSFSTIGNTSEGAGCHTLYPDGSVGFARGVSMLHENVAFLCACQGVSEKEMHQTDLLGNLLRVYNSPRLGTLCDNQEVVEIDPDESRSDGAMSAILENSQPLDVVVKILPHYS